MQNFAQIDTTQELPSALDRYLRQLNSAPHATVVDEMIGKLGVFYDSAARSGSLDQFRHACQSHPLHKIALEDPFTERAFTKPRGHAGDAVMLGLYLPPRQEGAERDRIGDQLRDHGREHRQEHHLAARPS